MRYFPLLICFWSVSLLVKAQTGDDLIAELKAINTSVAGKACNTDSAAAISHRAMNVFMADKTSYLSASRDLSFYTNYATFNTAEGKFTVNHNFQQKATSNDEPIKRLFSAGFDMTVAGNYAKSFLDKRFEYEIAIALNYTWLGKVKTRFADCTVAQNNTSQKRTMDALRMAMIEQLQMEIRKKEADFTMAINAADSASADTKKLVKENFYTDLKAAYDEIFSLQQAALLTKTSNFKLITSHWTSITAYFPLLFPKYAVAELLTSSFNNKHPYPLAVTLAHTRMWESAQLGRLFFTLEGNMLFNNSKLSYGLSKLNYSEYKNLGGTAAQQTADPGNNKLYIGTYKNFITPTIRARCVYFPASSHVGISFLAEQNFGDHNLLNCKLGIPIVLINSRKTPAVTVECYVLFFNLTNKISAIDYTSAGLSIGIPFSRLMY